MRWLIICNILVAFFVALQCAAMALSILVPLHHQKIKLTCSTITVGRGGNFTSIQSALNSVPQNNQNWICIKISQGTYRERIYIPDSKPYLYLEGAGRRKTSVVSDGNVPLDKTATLISQADNIVAEGISFVNTWRNPRRPAAAAKIEGDKSAFYGCGFFGLQDTLWDVKGRHYFKQCTIEGAVDFIFGSGQSIYEKCVISVTAQDLVGGVGFITSQGREHPNETNGFVFKHCHIMGNGKAFLGRPWRPYARVIFYKTFMTDVVLPQGWTAAKDQEQLVTFEEVGCLGPGSNSRERVKWADKLGYNELKHFIKFSYIDDGGWVQAQPQIIDS